MRERADLMWNNRMLEQRAAAGEQIQDTAALLEQMAERIYQLRGLKEKEFARLEKELKYEKILCRGAWYFRRDERYPEVYSEPGDLGRCLCAGEGSGRNYFRSPQMPPGSGRRLPADHKERV